MSDMANNQSFACYHNIVYNLSISRGSNANNPMAIYGVCAWTHHFTYIHQWTIIVIIDTSYLIWAIVFIDNWRPSSTSQLFIYKLSVWMAWMLCCTLWYISYIPITYVFSQIESLRYSKCIFTWKCTGLFYMSTYLGSLINWRYNRILHHLMLNLSGVVCIDITYPAGYFCCRYL